MKTMTEIVEEAENHIKTVLADGRLDLRQKRDILKNDSYSDAHPASAESIQAHTVWKALVKFDAEHPEIVEAIKAEEVAKRAEKAAELKNSIAGRHGGWFD